MHIGIRIQKLREEYNLTQAELANKAGLKPPAISQYEAGLRSPSYEALIKLSGAMGVSIDYLVSGDEKNDNILNDKTSKILMKIISDMNMVQKEQLLKHLTSQYNPIRNNEIPFFEVPSDYADYIAKYYSDSSKVIDLFAISKRLNIKVIEVKFEGDYEGTLIRSNTCDYAILNQVHEHIKDGNDSRKRFTLAMLIGLAVIPWCIDQQYNIRKKGESSLNNESKTIIEAQKFASVLLLNSNLLKKIVSPKLSLKLVKQFAEENLVSLTSVLNRLVETESSKYSWFKINKDSILQTINTSPCSINLANKKSYAMSFFNDEKPICEEIREGVVPAHYWDKDSNTADLIFESSIYNPQYNEVITLISPLK